MKRFLQYLVLGTLMFSLSSCGLPAALMRSIGSVAQSAGGLIIPAAAAAL